MLIFKNDYKNESWPEVETYNSEEFSTFLHIELNYALDIMLKNKHIHLNHPFNPFLQLFFNSSILNSLVVQSSKIW